MLNFFKINNKVLILKILYKFFKIIPISQHTIFKYWIYKFLILQQTLWPFFYTRVVATKHASTLIIEKTSYQTYLQSNWYVLQYFSKNTFNLWYYNYYIRLTNLNFYLLYWKKLFLQTFGDGFFYIRGLLLIFFIDGALTDDEPIWEPIEWSLVQTWILFIFIFAWIAENLITSRYGSYTGRDKRIWFAWYKTFWLLELIYMCSYGVAALFIVTPFYFEVTYHLPFVFCWWHWYTRVFFFKFISIYSVVIIFAYLFQLGIRWLNWKKLFFLATLVSIFIAYLLYTSFIITFFGYFTDPLWYQKSRGVDYVQLSHEPLKWGCGSAKRDHFTYHNTSTVFWFKSDGPFAGAFLMFHLFFFLSVFFLYLYWIVLLRRLYVMKEASYTYSVFVVSALKQFFYFFLAFFLFIFFSFIVNYWRFPIEFWWTVDSDSWWLILWWVCFDYISIIVICYLLKPQKF